MRLAILSQNPKLYSTSRLKEAAVKRGHTVKVLATSKFSIFVEEEAPDLHFKRKEVSSFDAVIPRIGASITFYGTAVVRQFEQMGIFCLNSSYAISVSRDKLRSLQILSRHDIGIPYSAFALDKADIMPAIEEVGGAPVIIKLLEGTQGTGVILADSNSVAEAIIETLHSAKQHVLIQKFVAESKGKDIRALVVGDRVVAAMRRVAQGQEYRSNVHRGATTEAVELDSVYERTAVRAAHIMGLHVAGVDMLEGKDGPQVMEINSSPGLEGIETITKVDVAGAIIEYLEDQIKFPEVDLRQKLTLGKGYEIAEIPISVDSKLAGKKISESELREHEILVLSINRNNLLLPSPRGETEFLPGDIALCYGKRLALQTLVPVPKTKRRKKKKRKKVLDEPLAIEDIAKVENELREEQEVT